MSIFRTFVAAFSLSLLYVGCKSPQTESAANPENATALASWQPESQKKVLTWLARVTNENSKDYIPVSDRIAVFDNDGTLWPEQPIPNQLAFTIDYLRSQQQQHPEWQKDVLIKSTINGDFSPLKQAGVKGLFALIDASHNHQTVDEFNQAVRNWIDTAKEKKWNKRYKDAVYQPMIELLQLLRQYEFTTFIVSGGGADFMRVWTEEVYGIPPYQVIGSYGAIQFDKVGDKVSLRKVPGEVYIDDKSGKPVSIHRFIGKVPVFCAGNSDGDLAMMQYTATSTYPFMNMLIHHTDSVREYAYDKRALSGHLEEALLEARQRNWMVVNMQQDWNTIFK